MKNVVTYKGVECVVDFVEEKLRLTPLDYHKKIGFKEGESIFFKPSIISKNTKMSRWEARALVSLILAQLFSISAKFGNDKWISIAELIMSSIWLLAMLFCAFIWLFNQNKNKL